MVAFVRRGMEIHVREADGYRPHVIKFDVFLILFKDNGGKECLWVCRVSVIKHNKYESTLLKLQTRNVYKFPISEGR